MPTSASREAPADPHGINNIIKWHSDNNHTLVYPSWHEESRWIDTVNAGKIIKIGPVDQQIDYFSLPSEVRNQQLRQFLLSYIN